MRNEADIWSHTLEAALKLFDHLYIVEHWPTDRTDEITAGFRAQYPDSISTFSLRQQGYFQCEVSGLLARKAFSDGADWVFFVDADEFLRFRSRSALEQALTGHDGEVVSLAWRNLMPNRPGSFTTFELAQPFQARRAPSPYGKIVIHRDWAARFPTFEIALGNHSLIPWYGAAHVLGTRVGEMLHIPIRSVERFREKVTSGIAAIEARAGDTPGGGRHLYEFASVLATGSEAEIAALALDYGSPAPATGDDATLVEVDDLVGDALVSAHAGQPGRDAAETRAMDAAVQWRPSPAARGRKLAVIAGSEIEVRLRPMSGRRTVAPAQFSRLPDEPLRAIDTPIWIEATRAAFAPVETTVSSAWTGHVPTLFFLMRLLSPRRYVELGTQNGMSFFAACQAAAGAEPLCECVAVDSWEGDIQAGMFGEKVFADFEDRLHSSYPHIGSYIRGLFDDAAVCFEDGSIDLLHIDGLHTYEAVRNDFVTWLPKMSSRGVVILHDTMVEDEGFGVWKFWREIAGRYPSWNALHTYGLGIALVGEPRGEFAELLRAASAGDAIGGVVNEIAAGIGRLVMDAADRTLRQATADARAAPRATPAQAEATKAAVDQALRKVHSSLSWRVTRPLRWAGRLVRNLTGKKHNG